MAEAIWAGTALGFFLFIAQQLVRFYKHNVWEVAAAPIDWPF